MNLIACDAHDCRETAPIAESFNSPYATTPDGWRTVTWRAEAPAPPVQKTYSRFKGPGGSAVAETFTEPKGYQIQVVRHVCPKHVLPRLRPVSELDEARPGVAAFVG